jgi:peptide subunit release factor 1 (eRF1)
VNCLLQPVLSRNKLELQYVQLSLQQKKVSILNLILNASELKLYKSVPPNGLVLFCGVIEMGDGKTEKKVMIDLEPFKQINVFAYRC